MLQKPPEWGNEKPPEWWNGSFEKGNIKLDFKISNAISWIQHSVL